MASGLTQTEAVNEINFRLNTGAQVTPTTPIKGALSTATTSSTAAGTEVVGGSYARQTFTPGTVTAGNPSTCANSAAMNYTNMPAATVTDTNLYDSNGTPARLMFGALTASKTTAAGDTLSFAIGAYVVSAA
jgi:hypothetical protein